MGGAADAEGGERVCPVCGRRVATAVRRHKTLGVFVPVWTPGPCRNPACEAYVPPVAGEGAAPHRESRPGAERSGPMKYLVMVRGTQADYEGIRGKASETSPAWTEEERQAMFAHMGEINDELAKSGELIDAQGLLEPVRARTVTVGDDGRAVVTDAPYGPTEEVMAGYWVVECDSLERVTEIAEHVARSPGPEGTPHYPVVIRPIMEGADEI